MNIENLDKNFIIKNDITEPDIVWLDAKEAPFDLNGIIYDAADKRYVRLPQQVAEATSEGVFYLNRCTAGGRVRFRTNSNFIAIHLVAKNLPMMPHIPLLGESGCDIYQRETPSETPTYLCSYIPPIGTSEGYSSQARPNGNVMREFTINLPLYDEVNELYIAVKKDADLLPPFEYRNKLPVVYYGSSITQGGCASRPGNSYQAILSRRLDTDYINLGFSGNAKGEDAITEYIASLNMSVFVCDYDHNAPSAEHLLKTHYLLYKKVRTAQPDLPIIILSAPDILLHPDFFAERREVIIKTYERALSEGDKNVYFINGAELFSGDCWDACSVDGCHPNDLGFYRMAMRIEKDLKPLLK